MAFSKSNCRREAPYWNGISETLGAAALDTNCSHANIKLWTVGILFQICDNPFTAGCRTLEPALPMTRIFDIPIDRCGRYFETKT